MSVIKMSDQIRLTPGRFPWDPAQDAQRIRVYNEYDIPLEGILIQDECRYLFYCAAGRLGGVSVWTYTHLSQSKFDSLDRSEGREFDKLSRELRMMQGTKLAIAFPGQGIVADIDWLDFPDGLDDAVERLRQNVHAWIDGLLASQGQLDEMQFADLVQAG